MEFHAEFGDQKVILRILAQMGRIIADTRKGIFKVGRGVMWKENLDAKNVSKIATSKT